jgi:hypothetical protein
MVGVAVLLFSSLISVFNFFLFLYTCTSAFFMICQKDLNIWELRITVLARSQFFCVFSIFYFLLENGNGTAGSQILSI